MVTPKKDKGEGKHRDGKGAKDEADYGETVKECPECGAKNLIRDYGRAELFARNADW